MTTQMDTRPTLSQVESVTCTIGDCNRRVTWWQAMTEHNHAHLQTMAAIWGQLPDGPQTLTSEGVLPHTANPFAVAFSGDLHLFCGTVRNGGFLCTVGGKTFFCGVHFRRQRQQRLRQRTRPAHRLQTHLQSNTLEHIDGKDHSSL